MNFTCDKCQRRYTIADDKVRGKTVKIRCKHCQNVISVTGPEVPAEDRTRVVSSTEYESVRALAASPAPAKVDPWKNEPTRAAPLGSDEWFAMVKGQQIGPLVGSALFEKIINNEISPRTYLWKDGMADWKRASDIAEVSALFGGAPASPPPMKGAPPPPPEIVLGAPDPLPFAEEADVALVSSNGATGHEQPLGAADDADSPTDGGTRDLFSDLELQPEPQQEAKGDAKSSPFGTAKPRKKDKDAEDPFAALGALDPSKLPASGENTSFFIAQAGMNKRNPPWKIAMFVLCLIALPVGILYALSETNVVPLRVVTRVDEKGQEVKESVFSAEGVGGLRDLLLGKKHVAAPRPVATAQPETKKVEEPKEREPRPPKKEVKPAGPSTQDLASFYGDTRKADVGPRVKKHTAVPTQDSSETGGPPEQEVARVVAQTQPAFTYCIEQELKRNPGFHGGKVFIIATVGSSGAVKTAKIDKHEIDNSNLGDCIKTKAKRMVFAQFSGDDVDLEIPLLLTTSM